MKDKNIHSIGLDKSQSMIDYCRNNNPEPIDRTSLLNDFNKQGKLLNRKDDIDKFIKRIHLGLSSLKFMDEIYFFSSTKARINIVLNFATSEGWKEKIPKLSHLWAP